VTSLSTSAWEATDDLAQRESSVQFTSDKYDDLLKFVKDAECRLSLLFSRVSTVSKRCGETAVAIDEMLLYSYQYNLKIAGMPAESPNSAAERIRFSLQYNYIIGNQNN